MSNATVQAAARTRARGAALGFAAALGLGALWGIAEVTLGTGLHASQVPFAGQLMIPIGICCALGARRLLNARGIVLAVGTVAASIRLCSPGGFMLMPALAILIEAAVMETCLLLAGDGRAGFTLAGAAAACYPLLHGFVLKSLFFGIPLAAVYAGMTQQACASLSLPAMRGPLPLLAWALVTLATGGAIGFAGRAVFPARRQGTGGDRQ